MSKFTLILYQSIESFIMDKINKGELKVGNSLASYLLILPENFIHELSIIAEDVLKKLSKNDIDSIMNNKKYTELLLLFEFFILHNMGLTVVTDKVISIVTAMFENFLIVIKAINLRNKGNINKGIELLREGFEKKEFTLPPEFSKRNLKEKCLRCHNEDCPIRKLLNENNSIFENIELDRNIHN